MIPVLVSRRRRGTLLKGVAIVSICLLLLLWLRTGRDSNDQPRRDQNPDHHVEKKQVTSNPRVTEPEDERKSEEHARPPAGEGQVRAPYRVDKKPSPKGKAASDGIMNVVPGLGEGGEAVELDENEKKLAKAVFQEAAFNVYLSNRISVNRTVPDARHKLCRNMAYDKALPTASVIIIFTNEMWSTLLRTIWSVVNRTPSRLLKQIILVDDYSDRSELKRKLDNYLNEYFPTGNVKLIRLPKREGLIRARLTGAKAATGDVLVFLDSHCEVNIQWLEPLLQRIKDKPKNVLCPIIDIIDDNTFEYQTNNGGYFQIGGFTWQGHFAWIEIPPWEEKRKKSPVDPTRSPTMAGGLFAMDRNHFWQLGGYDSGMDIWGGENLEMSFRVWMCGSELEIIPCSHVGHVFRSFHPYTFPGNKDNHGINTVRVVEVWMDEYKKHIYMNRPDLQNVDYGDISERVELRNKLRCKSFRWYLQNVYPQKFVNDEKVSAYGTVRNPLTGLCLDILKNDESSPYSLGLNHCKHSRTPVLDQWFSLSEKSELRREENCAEVMDSRDTEVTMIKCNDRGEGQTWIHKKGGPVVNEKTHKCLEVRGAKIGGAVKIARCHGGHSQIWWFDKYTDIDVQIDQERP